MPNPAAVVQGNVQTVPTAPDCRHPGGVPAGAMWFDAGESVRYLGDVTSIHDSRSRAERGARLHFAASGQSPPPVWLSTHRGRSAAGYLTHRPNCMNRAPPFRYLTCSPFTG